VNSLRSLIDREGIGDKKAMRKICVFPNDSMRAYYRKGEVKEGYFNPCNFFNEVQIISPCERDIEENKVQMMAGDAKLKIFPIGKFHLLNFFSHRNKVLKLIEELEPEIIRAYNPLVQGYFAVYCGKKLRIPTVVSLHGNYDKDIRELLWEDKQLKKYFKYLIYSKTTEPYVLKNATKVICVYEFPVQYAKKYGAKDIEVIYNRVDTTRFRKTSTAKPSRPTVMCVGRLIREKNQQVLIKAVKNLDVNLLLIGDGPLYSYLTKLTKNLGIEEKAKFIKSVPNSEIHKYYSSADIFAIPIRYGGVCTPVIEAMSSSLPIVVPKPRWEDSPELVGDIAIVVENTPKGFEEAFKKLMSNPKLRKELGEKGRKRALEVDGRKMERKEMNLYKRLIEEDSKAH